MTIERISRRFPGKLYQLVKTYSFTCLVMRASISFFDMWRRYQYWSLPLNRARMNRQHVSDKVQEQFCKTNRSRTMIVLIIDVCDMPQKRIQYQLNISHVVKYQT